MLINKTIFIVSNEPWGATWYSKHNYAWELSEKNQVFFINPAVRFGFSNIINNKLEEKKIKDNLSVITYKNIFPVRFEPLRLINEWFIFKQIKKHIQNKHLKNIIFWTFDPIRLTNPKIINPDYIILHMVDKYLFKTKAEYIIAKNSAIVLCVADEIAKDFYNLNKNVHVIPHAIPKDEFLPLKTEINKPLKAVYIGNIDLRIDYKFLKFIIEKFPDIMFEFVGKLIINNIETYGIFDGRYKNVVCRGEQPFKQLKYYVQQSDFCFLFKDIYHLGNSISSHKMLQYFAQGKPIFCTKLSRYEDIKDLLYMENDKIKMAELIENFIHAGDSKDASIKRINYAQAHSFFKILKQIETIIDGK